jgi:hypothetical protein
MNDEYIELFRSATERTRVLNLLPDDDVSITSESRYLNFWMEWRLRWFLSKKFKGLKSSHISLQCFNLHSLLQRELFKNFGINSFFTLGYIKKPNINFFEFSEADVSGWLKNGLKKEVLNMHAWLTLPSGEIIDISFLHTMAVKFNKKLHIHVYIGDYSDKLKNMDYIPMYIGDKLLIELGAIHT